MVGGPLRTRDAADCLILPCRIPLCPKLCLGQHVREAPLRSHARRLDPANETPCLSASAICGLDVFRHAAKRSFGEMRSQAELGTEDKSYDFCYSRDQNTDLPIPISVLPNLPTGVDNSTQAE